MTRHQARDFAEQWAAAWNARAVEQVLARFADGVVFLSPLALAVTGSAEVLGKEALRAYWTQALHAHPSLRFVVDRTLWDPSALELVILYEREISTRRERGAEVLTFGPDWLVVRGEAFYGRGLEQSVINVEPEASPSTTW